MLIDSPTAYLAAVLALGIVAQWLAWRLRLPSIVLLLGIGFAARYWFGPPERFLSNQFLFPIVALGVGIILFEGGLSLRLREVRNTGGVVFRLVTIGLLVTWLLAAYAAHLTLGFSWQMAVLIGALLTVSGPTVIVPLLPHVRPVGRMGSLIKWEGIVNDPIGAMLAALVFKAIVQGAGSETVGRWLMGLGATLSVGILVGGITAWITIQLLRRYWVPDSLQNPVVLALVLLVFAVSNYFQKESGLLTVTIMGIILANQRTVTIKHVIEFKENLRVLLISTLFILLASHVDIWTALRDVGWRTLMFLAALVLVIRPVSVFVATLGSDLRWNERLLLAWVHPRGIVAAAVASLLALDMADTPFAEEAEKLVLVTFLVIVGTVLIYGSTLAAVARRLGLAVPEPQGILFAGASPWVREIAAAVKEEGFPVMLVDTNHENISAARMAGLATCYASIGSEHVRDELDLTEIGRLLAMTPNDEVNTLAAMEFAERFGRVEVYQLATTKASSQRRDRVASYLRGRTLFRKDATYELLASRWGNVAKIKKTLLTQNFTFEDFRNRYGMSAIVLFVLDESGKLIVNTTEGPKTLKAGQKVIALVEPVEPVEPAEPAETPADEAPA
jgi:NhaP-type Na+/H+ or K+/H+ antiporter